MRYKESEVAEAVNRWITGRAGQNRVPDWAVVEALEEFDPVNEPEYELDHRDLEELAARAAEFEADGDDDDDPEDFEED